MDQAENVDGPVVNLDDQAVVADQQLANVGIIELGDHSPAQGELIQ
jgi:hypothetical protein